MTPVPVTVLSGFLGAGKTTLLNRLLADPALAGTGVVVNEFGEVGIDAALIAGTAEGGIVELAGGCLCCTVRGALVDTLADLAAAMAEGSRAPLARLVVETSGLADPAPVVAALLSEPRLARAYRLDAVVAVLDAVNGAATLASHEEARRQAALADVAVLTKGDAASAPERAATLAAFRRLNRDAPLLDATAGEARPDLLFAAWPEAGPAFARRLAEEPHGHGPHGHGPHDHHGHDHHDDHHHEPHAHGPAGLGSVSIRWNEPIARGAAIAFAESLVALSGPKLLRFKAIVETREEPGRPLVLHAVAGRMERPDRLSARPAGFEGSRFVAIGEGLSERQLRDLLSAFAGWPSIDAPDRAALEDNPLAISNYAFR